MCAACGCGKKKGQPGYGKGKPAKKKSSKPLTGNQSKIDVAPPKGKITGADFKKLGKKK
jgi:hypothetical protein